MTGTATGGSASGPAGGPGGIGVVESPAAGVTGAVAGALGPPPLLGPLLGPPSRASWLSSCCAFPACSVRHSTRYSPATIWLVEVKSRRPPVKEYEINPNSRPKAAPMMMAANTLKPSALPKSEISKPTKRPNQAPESIPASATRAYVRRPVTRSTICRLTPTMVTAWTGKCWSDR